MNRICKFAIGTLAASAVSAQAAFPWGEIADEINLAAPGVFTSIDVAYSGMSFSGNETLTVNLYNLDGPATPGSFGFNTPGSLLFSGTVPLGAATGVATISDISGTLNLAGTVAVGLVFGGIDFPFELAGPVLYDPPTPPGSSLSDYWVKDYLGDPDWALYLLDGVPANFGISLAGLYDNLSSPIVDANGNPLFLSPIPEPGTWVAMIGFGAIAGSMAFRRIRGSK